MIYNFPAVKFVEGNTAANQLIHVFSEVREIQEARDEKNMDMEIMDLYHSIETYFRIKGNGSQVKKAVYKKNKKRGYYLNE